MKKQYRSDFNTRQNMLKENYEIYYYSDSHFQNVSPHKHDYYEFYFPVDGEIEMEIMDERIPLTARAAAIIPPGTIHRALTLSSERSYNRYVFWISAKLFSKLASESEGVRLLSQTVSEEKRYVHFFSESEYSLIQSKILRLIEEEHSVRFAREDMIRISISDLLLTLSRLIHEHDHPERSTDLSDPVQGMIEYIDHNIDEELTLEKLGEQFYLSKYYAAHIFRERTGMTLHRYIQKKRLERCADDIKTGRPVSIVSRDYGFSDYSSFFRAFKKEYHLSPREFQSVYVHDPAFPAKQQSE